MENNVKTIIEKKVYGLIIESDKTCYLSIQAAGSLEEAFSLARAEFYKTLSPLDPPPNLLDGAKIGLFTIKTFKELISPEKDAVPTPPAKKVSPIIDPKDAKNLLMRQIIKNKDEKTLDENRAAFTQAELEYLKTHLKDL